MPRITSLIEIIREVRTDRFFEVELKGGRVIEIPYSELNTFPGEISAILDEFSSQYNSLVELLSESERVYGVTPIPDVEAIQRGRLALTSYAEQSGIKEYVGEELHTIADSVEGRKKADYAVISNFFRFDEPEKNIELAKQSGLSDKDMGEMTDYYHNVGYLWFFFDNLQVE